MTRVDDFIFKKIHNNNLIYNTCWEDPRIDRKCLELDHNTNLLVITSAGCNALDYVIAGANKVNAVDMNFRQNALLELKIAAARGLEYEDYFLMFGKGTISNPRLVYQEKLKPYISKPSQDYWDRKIDYFSNKGYRNSFYFHGTSGFVARAMKTYLEHIVKAGDICQDLLDCQNLEEQKDLYFNRLKPKIWKGFIKSLVKKNFFMTLLGVPKAQIEQVSQYHQEGMAGFVEDCLDAVFGTLPFQDNYFWRVYLQGHYDDNCCPEYLTYHGYDYIRNHGFAKVNVVTNTISGFLESQNPDSFSHFVLLDHMDWLYSNLKSALIDEWKQILRVAKNDARVIFRSGGYKVEYLDDLPVTLDDRDYKLGEILNYNYELAESLHPYDRVHTYGSFYIADINKSGWH